MRFENVTFEFLPVSNRSGNINKKTLVSRFHDNHFGVLFSDRRPSTMSLLYRDGTTEIILNERGMRVFRRDSCLFFSLHVQYIVTKFDLIFRVSRLGGEERWRYALVCKTAKKTVAIRVTCEYKKNKHRYEIVQHLSWWCYTIIIIISICMRSRAMRNGDKAST